MLRTASVPTSLWMDDSFSEMPPAARLLYLTVLTQPELDAAGILPLRPTRWAHGGMTRAELEAALDVLYEAGWAHADLELQDLFVSGYFEAERIAKQPRRLIAATRAIARAESERLGAIASAELTLLIAAHVPPAPRGIRARVLERDGYRCCQCGWKPGDPVPAKAKTDEPVFRTLELDHIYPRSKGGPDKEENFQVLCTTCNCRKGARV